MSNKTNQGREQYIFDRIGEVLTSHIIRLRDRGEVASANHLVDCFSQQISDIEAGLDPKPGKCVIALSERSIAMELSAIENRA